jgi:anti-sigma B factor antagonist
MPQEAPDLQIRQNDDVTIITLSERKILDELTITRLGDQLQALVARTTEPKFVIDFTNVSHMSSSALGMLITLLKRTREKNGQLRLANIQPAIREVFDITRLTEVFHICDSVEDAMASIR